jgi:hypothetical protein
MTQVNAPIHRLRSPSRLCIRMVLPLLLIVARPAFTELPDAPTPQSSAQDTAATGTLTGIITDHDGAAVAGAKITLLAPGQTQPSPNAPTTLADEDGVFVFPNLPTGAFTLVISAAGFAPTQASGDLRAGETLQLPTLVLGVNSTTDVQVTASQTEIAEAQVQLEEQQRIFGAIPNFYVSYISNPVPLDPKQKFELAFRTMVDPVSFVLVGVTAAIEQGDDDYAWQQGALGYGKRYAAAYGTFIDSTLLGNAILPILLKQDPRYFYKGTGTVRARALYAIANAVICKGDNHHWQFNYSAIGGSIAANALSSFYYPAPNRAGAGLTFEGAAIGTGFSAVTNLVQEFFLRKVTPHVPPSDTPPTPNSPKPPSTPASPSEPR